MVMQRWDPFNEMINLRNQMDRLFEDFFGPLWSGSRRVQAQTVGTFPIDIYETQDNLLVKASLPGVKPEDIKVTSEGNTVTIEAEMREEIGDAQARYQEHRYGKVLRSFTLPETVDASKATANYEHGVLTLTFPRTEAARVRQIPVMAGATPQAIPAQATSGNGQSANQAQEPVASGANNKS
jgi:HSP20 family protein